MRRDWLGPRFRNVRALLERPQFICKGLLLLYQLRHPLTDPCHLFGGVILVHGLCALGRLISRNSLSQAGDSFKPHKLSVSESGARRFGPAPPARSASSPDSISPSDKLLSTNASALPAVLGAPRLQIGNRDRPYAWQVAEALSNKMDEHFAPDLRSPSLEPRRCIVRKRVPHHVL